MRSFLLALGLSMTLMGLGGGRSSSWVAAVYVSLGVATTLIALGGPTVFPKTERLLAMAIGVVIFALFLPAMALAAAPWAPWWSLALGVAVFTAGAGLRSPRA